MQNSLIKTLRKPTTTFQEHLSFIPSCDDSFALTVTKNLVFIYKNNILLFFLYFIFLKSHEKNHLSFESEIKNCA
jgi:hypothetical protein